MSVVPTAFLQELPGTIAADFKLLLPALKQCKGIAGRFNLDRLKSESVKAPAILVSMTRMRQQSGQAGPQHIFNLEMAAFIITKDVMGLGRDEAAANIGQAIAAYIPDQTWGQDACGEAENVSVEPIVTGGLQGAKTSLWAVTWTQPCVLVGVEAVEPVDLTLYVGQSPNVGPGNEDHYEVYSPEDQP